MSAVLRGTPRTNDKDRWYCSANLIPMAFTLRVLTGVAGRRDMTAGTRLSATNDEMTTATANTRPNSWKSRPAVPGRKAIGTNTAMRTAVVAMTAKKTRRVPCTAALLGPAPSARCRCTLSSTTMASSTIKPAASTKASKVRILMEKPNIQLAASVPRSEMGMAIAGTSVSLMDPVNSLIVPITTRMEISKVVTTSRTDPLMKMASSEMMSSRTPSILTLMSRTASRTPSAMRMVFEPACRTTLIPTTRSPLRRTKLVVSSGENATLAT